MCKMSNTQGEKGKKVTKNIRHKEDLLMFRVRPGKGATVDK